MHLVICNSQVATWAYQWHFIHGSVVNLAVVPACQKRKLRETWKILTMPASLFIRFTQEQLFSLILSWYRWERCAFEKLRIRLLFTYHSMSKLWLFWSSGSYLMLGLWSRHFPPARTWLSAQHNICFSKIFVAGRKSAKLDTSAGEWLHIWEIWSTTMCLPCA